MKINLQLFGTKRVDDAIVQAVIRGNYGNGEARKTALAKAGYNPSEVQAAVNAKLGSSSSTATKTPTASTTTTTPAATANNGFKYTPYEKSDVVKQAEAMLEQHKANAPGEFQYVYDSQLQENIEKLLNGEKFTYDLNGDALYQQYKDQYMLQGQQAMMDTMGQVAAMNGGYGSSYAQTAGQQTYQGYLQQLNDRVPELYQLALSQHNQEKQDLKDTVSLLRQQKEQEYGMHRDAVSDYNTELERLINEARYQGETDYSKYMDKTNMDYTMYSDAKEDAFDLATAYITQGVMPGPELLAAAGISSKDAQAYVNSVKTEKAAAAAAKKEKDTPVAPVDDKPIDDTPKFTYEETPAVTSFIARIRTRSEFARSENPDKTKYKTYAAYVKGMLEKYESELTDNDIATISQKFGL